MDKVSTGISDLDEALNGGIPRGNVVLISGGAGTGKSTLCLQYLVAGAALGERGLYISTEQQLPELEKQAIPYGWSLNELIDRGLLRVVFLDILQEESILEKIRGVVKAFSPARIVFDSASTISEYAAVTDFARDILLKRGGVAIRNIDEIAPRQLSERTLIKRMLASLLSEIRGFNSTVFLTSELPEKGNMMSSDGVTEFLADGVILLHHLGVGMTQFRSLQIRKMRYTGHSNEFFAYDFTKNGIEFVKNAV